MPNLIVKKSFVGLGIFAGKNFKLGEKILNFQGKIFDYGLMPNNSDFIKGHFIQIGKSLYLGQSGKEDDYTNHSCNPNAGVKISGKKAWMIAIKNIKKSKEITFDYSTTINEDNFEMECKCNQKNCRKTIKDFKYLPIKTKRKYARLGIVPEYNLKYCNGQ